jgi:hypothetical protein
VSFALQPESSGNFPPLFTPKVMLVCGFLLLCFFFFFSYIFVFVLLSTCLGHWADEDVNNASGFRVERRIV